MADWPGHEATAEIPQDVAAVVARWSVTRYQNDPATVALHEAAHAITAWHYGAWPFRIAVGPGCEPGAEMLGGVVNHLHAYSKRASAAIAIAGYVHESRMNHDDETEASNALAWRVRSYIHAEHDGDPDLDGLRALGVILEDGTPGAGYTRAWEDACRVLDRNAEAHAKLAGALAEQPWPRVLLWPQICELFSAKAKIFNCCWCGEPIDLTGDFDHLPIGRGDYQFDCGSCIALSPEKRTGLLRARIGISSAAGISA